MAAHGDSRVGGRAEDGDAGTGAGLLPGSFVDTVNGRPSNGVGWQARCVAAKAAQSLAAASASGSGPTISRNSAVRDLLFSRAATSGKSPSNRPAWPDLTEFQSPRSPSKLVAPPRSTANLRVAAASVASAFVSIAAVAGRFEFGGGAKAAAIPGQPNAG
jgi:hypothetical protein